MDDIIKHTRNNDIEPKDNNSLEERASLIKINDIEENDIIKSEIKNAVFEGFIDIVPGASFIKKVIEVADKTDELLNNRKKEMVISAYLNKTDNIEEQFDKLKKLLSDPYGLALYSMTKRLIEENPPTPEFLQSMGSVINYVSNQDIEKQFDKTKFLLNILLKLSAQEILLVKDHKNWPTTIHKVIGAIPYLNDDNQSTSVDISDFLFISEEFAWDYSRSRKISDKDFVVRVETSIKNIWTNNIFEINEIGVQKNYEYDRDGVKTRSLQSVLYPLKLTSIGVGLIEMLN